MIGNKKGAMKDLMAGAKMLFSGGSNKEAQAHAERTRTSEADVILFSGCRDDQTSADAFIDGTNQPISFE